MTLRFSPTAFSGAFCVAYLAVFAMNLPLFYFHPLTRQFSRVPLTAPEAGPAMAWYGLMASAGLIAAVAALMVREEWLVRALRNRFWPIPVAAIAGTIFLLRNFFR